MKHVEEPLSVDLPYEGQDAVASTQDSPDSSEESMEVTGNVNHEVSNDSEELLDLGEAVGTESRGLSHELIKLLPTSRYKAGGFFSRKKTRERSLPDEAHARQSLCPAKSTFRQGRRVRSPAPSRCPTKPIPSEVYARRSPCLAIEHPADMRGAVRSMPDRREFAAGQREDEQL
ncbi:hypothetical protein Droror1_Dr00005337 [Drosera rotundifolia]